MSSHARLAVAAAAFALALAGCPEDELTELVVLVDSDLDVPSELDGVRIEVDASIIRGRSHERSGAVGPGADSLPVSLGVVHEEGPLGPILVTATGTLEGAQIVTRRARVSFVRGRVMVLRLLLERSCVGVSCGAEATCAAGDCRSIDVPPEELEPYPPESMDAGVCRPRAELCNGVDDDCNGETDEGFDLSSDPLNCGACGRACEAPHAMTACEAGTCAVVGCEAEYQDCNAMSRDGCESNLRENDNCGECGVPCALFRATSSCGTGTCALVSCEPGVDNCDERQENGCEVETATDPLNCGGCGRLCAGDPAHGAEVCADSACTTRCDPGWGDCNLDPDDGCETDLSAPDTCGACDERCSGAGFLCSGDPRTGFRCIPPPCVDPPTRCGLRCVDLLTSPLHCGACDSVCPSRPHATPICTGGRCELACDPGWGDCDGDPVTGCETPLTTLSNCGACGVSCSMDLSEACVGGSCRITTCPTGLADCDGLAATGCEVDLRVDPAHCGVCGNACPSGPGATAACVARVCALDCMTGLFDCNGSPADGCESGLDTLTDCGACGVACAPTRATGDCAARTCAIASCDAGWGDCNTTATDGCETGLDTLTDCGACGVGCAPAHASGDCSGGSCAIASCDAGWGDCNLAAADGCEQELLDSRSHCGMCGNACDPGWICSTGTCVFAPRLLAIDSGERHSCALRDARDVFCWGDNGDGQLGDGTTSSRTTAALVSTLGDAVAIDVGWRHTCALRSSGELACWGLNNEGQLGDGSTVTPSSPVSVMGITDAVGVSAGFEHSCAVLGSGAVLCWGRDDHDQLGAGPGHVDELTPVPVVGLTDGVEVVAAEHHSCARRTGGQVVCWGEGDERQIGDGMSADAPVPVAVMGIAGAVGIGAGRNHTCAVVVGGAVRCWGRNNEGQLGDGTTTTPVSAIDMMGVTDALQVVGGLQHTCVLRASGAVVCTGDGSQGQRGDATTSRVLVPASVVGVADAVEIGAGPETTCAVRATGGAVCWGKNDRGQVGDGTTTSPALVPRTVLMLP